jgi:hypothetical protein
MKRMTTNTVSKSKGAGHRKKTASACKALLHKADTDETLTPKPEP